MTPIRRTAWVAGLAVLSLAGPSLAQPGMGGFPGMGGPTEVGVITITRQSVPYTTTLPGRVVASKTAEIRPQVGGIIKSVDFKQGSEVRQGALLYQIESDTYEASLAAAKATLERARVTASSAGDTVARYEKLVGSGVSKTDLSDAKLSLLQAQADVAAAEASVLSAQISFDRTRITAPISGAIGLSAVNQGALVTASQATAMATIRQLDPIYITLVDSSANLLKLRKAMQAGTLSGNGDTGTKVRITLEDGTEYDEVGTIAEAETVVSTTTGTFDVRATIANPERMLLPGMFVRATVQLGEETAFLVPQRAVTFNANGKATVLVVGDDMIATAHVLETSRSYGNAWVVTSGLDDGDEIIVDGLQKVSDGSKIAPLPVEIDDDGVIVQTISSNAAAPGDLPAGTMPSGGKPPAAASKDDATSATAPDGTDEGSAQ